MMRETKNISSSPTGLSGHNFDQISEILVMLNKNKELSVELMDAFLAEYQKTKDINSAIFRAQCEWDC